ncbi:MAG: hypothetical protein ACJAX5_000770 [Patiriisocius sp.]|jgi:hypothetical protein
MGKLGTSQGEMGCREIDLPIIRSWKLRQSSAGFKVSIAERTGFIKRGAFAREFELKVIVRKAVAQLTIPDFFCAKHVQ